MSSRIVWRRLLAAVGLTACGAALSVGGALAQEATFPNPSDEATLYERAKEEGELIWYNSAPLAPMRAVADDFEKKYPGIKVNVLRIPGVQQYGRFMQETQAGQHIADIVHLSDFPSMQALIRDGHIAEWQVPTRDRIPEDFSIGNFAHANYVTDAAIIYNVEKLTPEEVEILKTRNWEAVLDPRFKGRFAITTQKCGICYAPIHMFLEPKFSDRFGEEFIKKIAAQQPGIFADGQVSADRVVAGEYAFTYWNSGSSGLVRWQAGAPVRFIYLSPTPAYGNTWQGVSKYAPHPHAARLFQNWSMSEEGAKSLQERYGGVTVLEGYPDNRDVAKEPWYEPISEPYRVDFERWEKNYHTDMDIWIKSMNAAR